MEQGHSINSDIGSKVPMEHCVDEPQEECVDVPRENYRDRHWSRS